MAHVGSRRVGRSAAFALVTVAGACTGNKPFDPPPVVVHEEETTPPECTSDVGCVTGREICVDEVCVEGDRDDAFADARAIGLGDQSAPEGWIFPPGDVDHYVYRAPGPQWIWLGTVSNDNSALDTVISVFDAEGELHAVGDGFPVHPYAVSGTLRGAEVDFDDVLFVYLPTAGDWYVRVEDRTTFTGEGEPGGGRNWRYDLLAIEAPGTTEPDAPDAPSWELPLKDAGIIQLVGVVIDEPGDTDHLRVTFPFDGRPLEIWGQPDIPGSTAAPLVRLYDGADLVAEKAGLGGDAGWLSWFRAHPGTFAIEATTADGAGGPDAWYMVYVRTYGAVEAHPFFGTDVYWREQAPNDTPAEAQVLAPDAEADHVAYRLDGVIEVPDDRDWWSADAADTARITVRCWTERFGSLARLEVALATGGTEFAASDTPDADGAYLLDQPMPGPGPLEVRIAGAPGTGGPGHWYRCAVEVR